MKNLEKLQVNLATKQQGFYIPYEAIPTIFNFVFLVSVISWNVGKNSK